MALTIDSILKLPTSKKALILVIILCVMIGLYVYAFFLPRHEDLNLAQKDGNKLDNELSNIRTVERELKKYNEQVAKLNEEMRDALTLLPNEKEIPEILKNISSLGKESNLEFTLFRPKPEQPRQFFANVPIDLVALGSYHNVGIFFDKVSKLPRITNVVDFSLTSVKDTTSAKDIKGMRENEVLLKISCAISTYRFIEMKSEEKKSGTKAGPKKETEDEEISKIRKK